MSNRQFAWTGPAISPDSASKSPYWNRQVPQRAKSNDKDVINELVSRQDDVIGQLDKLEAEILETIESLNTARREQQEEDASAADTEQSDTIKLPRPEQATDDGSDQSSRAA